jgi:hypothetical protein
MSELIFKKHHKQFCENGTHGGFQYLLSSKLLCIGVGVHGREFLYVGDGVERDKNWRFVVLKLRQENCLLLYWKEKYSQICWWYKLESLCVSVGGFVEPQKTPWPARCRHLQQAWRNS